MSLMRSARVPLNWSNVDVFTSGKSSLYGYDSLNHCIIVNCSIELNNLNNLSTECYHLSSSPTWPIRKLLLNQDETILALLADKIAYLVYLPQSNINIQQNSPSKGSRLCPIIRVPPLVSCSLSINCCLIDFIWLTSNHFVIVYSVPSSSECHLYKIRSLKSDGIEHIQTFSVGSSSTNKFGTPNKKISLYQPSDIIKLDLTKRKEKDIDLIFLFAMKTDGDLFLLEIDQNELLSNKKVSGEFQGPIRILPSTFNNYGADHGLSTFICLSNNNSSIVVFTRNKFELNQSIILSPSLNQYYLYTIDLISLPKNEYSQMITLIIQDKFYPNRYFISDSNSNIHSIEISWIKQIQQGTKQIQSTYIQHLINVNYLNNNNNIDYKIQHIDVIQTNNQQLYLTVIVQSITNQQKELIVVGLPSLESSDESEFVDRIRSLLSRDQSIPYVTLSTSTTKISNSDFEKNLLQFVKLFNEQYIGKQEQIRQEIENKQRYLNDFQQTQFNENEQLNQRFKQIQQLFQNLIRQFQQECARRNRLSTHVDDLLSVIEQSTPVLSDAEIRMQQQLEKYLIQINCLKEKIQLLQRFLSSNPNQEPLDNLAIQNIQSYLKNSRNQIDQLKERLQTIQINK